MTYAPVHAQGQRVRPVAVGACAALCLATVVGSVAGTRWGLIVPLALGGTVALGAAAIKNFPAFVLGLLTVRPVLDASKFSRATGLFEPTTVVSVALLCVAPLWLMQQRRERGPAPLTPLTAGMLALLASFALSTESSLVPSTSIQQTLKAAAWVVMFLVVRRLARDGSATQFLKAFAVGAVVPTILAVYELLTPGAGAFAEVKNGVVRVKSTFDESNDYARYLMLLILVAVAVLPLLNRRRRWLVGAAAGFATVLLGTTYTRSAWLGLVVGILALAFAQRRWALLAMVGLGIVVVLVLPQTSGDLTELASSASANHATDDSVAWRLNYWKEIAPLAKINPVTGIGPNVTTYETTQAKEPHNEYLRSLTEGGGVGLVAYLFFLGTSIAAGMRAARRGRTASQRCLGAAFLAVALAVTIAGAGSNIILGVSFMWFFAALAGFADAFCWAADDGPAARYPRTEVMSWI